MSDLSLEKSERLEWNPEGSDSLKRRRRGRRRRLRHLPPPTEQLNVYQLMLIKSWTWRGRHLLPPALYNPSSSSSSSLLLSLRLLPDICPFSQKCVDRLWLPLLLFMRRSGSFLYRNTHTHTIWWRWKTSIFTKHHSSDFLFLLRSLLRRETPKEIWRTIITSWPTWWVRTCRTSLLANYLMNQCSLVCNQPDSKMVITNKVVVGESLF